MNLPIYIVSLKRDIERRNKINDVFHRLNINFDFFDAIDAKDPQNKEIIDKMTRISPSDRYENIFEVKKALNKLFKRFSKSDRTYMVSIDTRKISHIGGECGSQRGAIRTGAAFGAAYRTIPPCQRP